MNIDTGAAVSLMPKLIYEECFGHKTLKSTSLPLKAYSGHRLELLGEYSANVSHKGKTYELPMVVADVGSANQPVLLGRNWLNVLRLDRSSVHQVALDSTHKLKSNVTIGSKERPKRLMNKV